MGPHVLAVGDRVTVHGGFDMHPAWLAASPAGYDGRVIDFIPGQNDRLAAVVELDAELVLPNGAGAEQRREVRGRYLVLELGHTGGTWATPTPRLHVELCDAAPPRVRWQDRARGVWVESHASYNVT